MWGEQQYSDYGECGGGYLLVKESAECVECVTGDQSMRFLKGFLRYELVTLRGEVEVSQLVNEGIDP